MEYRISELVQIIGGALHGSSSVDPIIRQIVFDTRKIKSVSDRLFIAINNETGNGHLYLKDAYRKGIRCFLISENIDMSDFSGACAIKNRQHD